MAFISRWRTISAFLFQGMFDQADWMESDSRNQNIHKAVILADSILRPYVADLNTTRHDARLHNLAMIMQRAARFAYTLFTQPSTWTFNWQESQGTSGEVVVFPALLQVFDGEQPELARPRVFVEGKAVLAGT
jgi:hypothetical protein